MANEDTNVEPAKVEPAVEPAKVEPVPNAGAPASSAPAPDLEALLTAERAKLTAESEAKIAAAVAAAKDEAIAAERERVSEEHRQAALSETEREAERVRQVEAHAKQLADENAAIRAREASRTTEVEVAARRVAFADALNDADVRLARGPDGAIDPALRQMAFEKAEQAIKASDGKLTSAQAIAELAKTSPWMFARVESTGLTNTGSSAGSAARLPAPPPPRQKIATPEDHQAALLYIARNQNRRTT